MRAKLIDLITELAGRNNQSETERKENRDTPHATFCQGCSEAYGYAIQRLNDLVTENDQEVERIRVGIVDAFGPQPDLPVAATVNNDAQDDAA